MRKKCLSVLLAAALAAGLLPGTAWAEDPSGFCGENVTWSYSGGVLTIQGTGPMDDYGWDDDLNFAMPSWSGLRNKIRTANIGDGVTSIGSYAFEEYPNLTRVTIPDSVTTIGDFAFNGCRRLPAVTIPNSVTTIGQDAFQLCGSLTAVTIPDSITVIGRGAFSGSGLTAVTIPDGVSLIDMGAFSFCESLTEAVIPDSVVSIGDTAFYECASLTDVYYGGSELQWEQLTVGGNNQPLSSAAIHCDSASPGMSEPAPDSEPASGSESVPGPDPAFTDVPGGAWYQEFVLFAVERGLIQGNPDGTFAPDDLLTRGQTLIILGRLDGADVDGGSPWYQTAMDWAVSRGVSDGTGPGNNISREELAVMLWRYAGQPGSADVSVLNRFPDSAGIHAWAGFREAMAWAVESGIITGTVQGGGTILDPLGNASRAQAVTMIQRYCGLLSQ